MENDEVPNAVLESWLFLGSRKARTDKQVLTELGIKHVLDLSCMENIKFDGIEYKSIAVDDNASSDLYAAFEGCINYLNNAKEKGEHVLVHCNQGISRSATIILAYLIMNQNMSLHSAWLYLKQRRRIIRPNDGFLSQLIKWEMAKHGKTTLTLGKYGQMYWNT